MWLKEQVLLHALSGSGQTAATADIIWMALRKKDLEPLGP